MNETRRTTLIEELTLIVADDIKNNKDTYVCIMSKEFNLTEIARRVITIIDRSYLTMFVTNVSDIDGRKYIGLASYEERITFGSLLNIIKNHEDPEIPETIILVVDGKEVLKDWSYNIEKNIPFNYLYRPVLCFCTQCLVDEGSAFEIQI